MTSYSGIDDARLTVLLDLRHPESYLALGPAISFATELSLEINWLPLSVPPLKRPSSPGPDDDRGIVHRRHRAHAIAHEIETYGRAQGLKIRDLYRSPDSSAFHLGWLWLRERDVERLPVYLAEAFHTYWSLALDPSSVTAIAALLDRVGTAELGGFERWCSGDGPEAAALLDDELLERGLFGVPGYVADGEVFLGRQHLPMIRWILGDRTGPGPI